MTVRVEGLSFSYGDDLILSDVSLEVGAGEVVALIGPNGSGKTTLLRCISGVLGEMTHRACIRIDGERLDTLKPRPLARKLAALETEVTAFFDFTAREIVEMGRIPYSSRWGALGAKDREIVDRALERADVSEYGRRLLSQMSSGEQQRVWLAMALAQEPCVLLLDEPTSHLDLNYQAEILSLLRCLASEGLSVLFSVHDLNLAALYADRIALLCSGRIIAQGPPDEILTEERIEDVYETPVRLVRDEGGKVIAVLPLGPAR